MKEESHNLGIDPEIEARIVALVLGEACDLERDQLMRLIEDRPELAKLKEQFESVNRLMREVGAGELPAADEDWQLSAENRNVVLAVLRGEAKERPTQPVVNKPSIARRRVYKSFQWRIAKIAAVFCVAGFFGWTAIFLSVKQRMAATAPMSQLATTDEDAPYFKNAFESVSSETSAPVDAGFESGGAVTMSMDNLRSWDKEPSGTLESDHAEDSKSSLLAIRDSLGVDAPVAEKGIVVEDFIENGKGVIDGSFDGKKLFGVGGFDGGGVGGGGAGYAGAFQSDAPGEPKPEETAARDFGFRIDSVEPKGMAALTTPVVPGERDEEEMSQPDGFSVTELSALGVPWYSVPSPTAEPMALRKEREKLADLTDADSYLKETAKDSVTARHEDDIALPNGPTLWLGTQFSDVQRGQSDRELQPEIEGREAQLRSRMPATKPQEQLTAPENVNADHNSIEFGTAAGTHLERVPQQGNDEEDRFGRESGEIVMRGLNRREAVQPMSEGKSQSIKAAPLKTYAAPAGLNESNAEDESFSTFSLHVSDVSFKLAQAALAQGEWPEAAKIRIEEFVNAFDYGDPLPSESEKVACRVEQCIHPFLQQRNMLRISMRTAAAGRASNTPLRLTFLLDNSGSMERIDRQQTVRRAFAVLAQQLKPIDQVTLISFARQPRLLADKVGGAQAQQLIALINDLPSEGGTNIEAALQLAFEKAQEQQAEGPQNRIILLTDGAVNLGDANPDRLSRLVTTIRDAGIAFDAAGISAEGLNDEILEALTRKGDGRYYLLDSLEAADGGFARQIAGALRPSAKNVKVQVEFNPKRVGRYKLLGFEKHILKEEDFRNDKVDAAEMAAAEAGVAVYQFEARPDGEGDVGSVSVRFRDLSTGQMIENRWPIPYEADAPRPDQAAPSLRIATSAALLAAKLRGEPLGETVDLKTLSDLLSGLPDRSRNANRVQQLQLMIGQARQVSGN